MDNKKLIYILAALLFIIILIAFISSRIGPKTIQVLQKTETQMPDETQLPLSPPQMAPALSPQPPVITVIKKIPRQERETSLSPVTNENQEKQAKYSPPPPASTATGGSAGGNEDEYAAEPPTPGITKLNKPPTPAEREEMQSKGIILY